MQDLVNTWHTLLNRHSQLLSELENGLTSERAALLANDLNVLGEAALQKDKITRQILNLKDTLKRLKLQTIKTLNLPPKLGLAEIFKALGTDQIEELLNLRKHVMEQSQSIDRMNKFNNRCLTTYLNYVEGIRSIFSLCKTYECKTYTPAGVSTDHNTQGRLLDRSF